MWKTLSPFWGEEYEVQLHPTFHSISIYVMDEDALRYGQSALGTMQRWVGKGNAQPHSRQQRIHTWLCS